MIKIIDYPRFVKSHKYYYSLEDDIIYGKEKYTHNYWHEYRHWQLHKKDAYHKFMIGLSELNQFLLITFPVVVIFNEFLKALPITFISLFYSMFFIFIGSYILVEEIDAEIFAYRKKRKNEK